MTETMTEAFNEEHADINLPLVLVVDDDGALLEAVARGLTNKEFRVVTAQDGAMALAMFQDERPDVVLLDYYMPKRNGAQILADMRLADPAVAVVMMTGYTNERVVADLAQESADGYILKPFQLAALVRTLERAIEQTRLRRDNADLIRKVAENRRAFDDQLRAAATIQAGMLPHWLQPDALSSDFVPLGFNLGYARINPCFTAGVAYEPAFVVAGDFYNALQARNDSTVLFIGDVSNKGLPAALFMSVAQVVLTMEFKRSPTLVEALDWANHHLYPSLSTADMFVTLFAVAVEPNTRTLHYVDAGHGHAFIRRATGAYESISLATGGLPLGILPDTTYSFGELTLNTGDLLVIYSDGLVDTPNAVGQVFGQHGLQEALDDAIAAAATDTGAGEGTAHLVRTVFAHLHTFANGSAPGTSKPQPGILADDRTLLLIQAT